jgi:AraC-like DNA-binding protein
VYAGRRPHPAAQLRKNVQAGLRRWLDTRIVERSMATIRVLLAGDDLTLGEFVCPPGDARWRTENDIGDGYHVVFPWTAVHIARRAMPAMVATPNHAVLYSPRLRFHRRHLTTVGDHCLFAVLSPRLAASLALDAPVGRLPDPVLPPALWLSQRLLAAYLDHPEHDPDVALGFAHALVAAAVRRPPLAMSRAGGQAVEGTKELLAGSPGELIGLERVAGAAHYSRFHLLRAFHARTGYTLHQYHLQLRLRDSVGSVLAGEPLADTALRLGFQGHSHYTARFRRAFGETPSAVRAAAADPAEAPRLIDRLLLAA